ncbi:centriole, cilia and spindle-associated protein [Eublepharis macularius]|uniref:Centriole, cilia and spindle-associated protein n=1 Tax=Eublepharis macularius TaxID=481883 RepID=A0AA97K593_EUBMA|nr:centriole, cilia and spindle-associated protein [Eublepharis macularius]
MVPSRCVKSEYMKCYKEPKWEACGPCYQELLRYRLSRRLLEQAHRPWFWDDWEQDSSSGGSPSPPGTSSPPAAQLREEEATAEVPSEPGPGVLDGAEETCRGGPAGPLRGSEEEDPEKAEEKAEIKEAEKKSAGKEKNNSTSRQTGQSPSCTALASRGDRRQAKSPQRAEAPKGTKHPFALYGWGEKQTDTGSQRTHNVCASASANEIHESALRAKNRRQVEKRKLSQRRIHSAEVERTWRTKSSGPDNPWMTEYMRCYSARAR